MGRKQARLIAVALPKKEEAKELLLPPPWCQSIRDFFGTHPEKTPAKHDQTFDLEDIEVGEASFVSTNPSQLYGIIHALRRC